MEIRLDKHTVKQVRQSAQDTVEEGDIEALRETLYEAFSEEQVEEIERRLDSGDFFEFLTDILEEWGGDDIEELMELLETQLGELDIELKLDTKGSSGEDEEDDLEDEDEDEDDFDDDDEDGESYEDEDDDDD